MDEFDFYNLVTRADLKAFDEAEKKAKLTAKRISEMKALLPVGVKDSDLKSALQKVDRARETAARNASRATERDAKDQTRGRPGGSLNNQNFLSVEGLGRAAGSIAVIAAVNSSLHALSEGLEAFNDAAAKGEDKWAAFRNGILKSLPVIKEVTAFAEELAEALNHVGVVTEVPAALAGKENFRFDPSADPKQTAQLKAEDDAFELEQKERRRERLQGLVGFDREKELVKLDAEERDAQVAKLRGEGALGGDVLNRLGKHNDAAANNDILKRESERIEEAVDDYFGRIEKELADEEDRASEAVDGFFGAVEEAFARQQQKVTELHGETLERDLRTAGKPGEAAVARIDRELTAALEEAGGNTDLRAALVENAQSELRALLPHNQPGQLAAAIAGDPNLSDLTRGTDKDEAADVLKNVIAKKMDETNRLLKDPRPATTI
jgi:hypothetical protein